ncbi:tetratricopeptide (TPR) repeat protein [Paraburkholderia sp. WC7.3g]|uniref:tetratricopeptide repeat protein n=1 Tax=Paraburkholderia sp. WC7.3g TaxID=2991070 RepID=UPI003D1F2DF0
MTLMQTPACSIADINQRAVSLCSAGQFADALPLVAPLLEDCTLPTDQRADALNIAGTCSFALLQWTDAENYWRQCLYLKPDYADVYASLGSLFRTLGRLSAAKSTYRQLVSLRPLDANAHHQLGNVLYGLGYRAEAEAAYRQTVTICPDHAEAHNDHGSVLMELGRLAEADAAFREALTLKPQYPEALNNLGGVLKATQRLAEAELACRLALAIRSEYPEAHLNLGAVLVDLDRVSEAEAAYREALVHRADYAEAHYNLGVALFRQERFEEAGQAYRDAIRCQPALAHAHNNLGCVLRVLERFPEALDAFRQALAVSPQLAEAHSNIANALTQLGRFAEAESAYRKAIALKPDYGEARFSLAVLLLGLGRFEEGWPLYECRYEQPHFIHRKTKTMLTCPQWSGEPLAGKSVLLWQEDGLGDMLQFSRYVPLLKALGAAHIAFACVPALHRLIANADGVDAMLDHDGALARVATYDCWTSLLSVPLYLRTTLETIPRPVRLSADAALVERWRPALDALPPGHRVGLVWKGNARHHNDANRSIPSLATLAPLWSVPGLNFVSLQKGQGEDEARNPPVTQPLLDLGASVTDFADSAAIVAQLDLVICVDTSIAHLAASLGKLCWVMLPERDVDWRWMHERDDSPWYPHTLRLFRRGPGEDWSNSVERVRQACVERFGGAL